MEGEISNLPFIKYSNIFIKIIKTADTTETVQCSLKADMLLIQFPFCHSVNLLSGVRTRCNLSQDC